MTLKSLLMLTNSSLDFRNEFNFEVYCDTECTVEIKINNTTQYKETFAAQQVYTRSLDFYYTYTDKTSSNLEIFFTGAEEVREKYLKINSLFVNSKKIDHLSYYYYPDLNPEWWNSLTAQEQTHMNDIIHINNGGHFGWYGRIKYEIRTVLDGNSHYQAGEDPNYALTRVLGFSNKNLVYQNNKNIRLDAPWLKKKL